MLLATFERHIAFIKFIGADIVAVTQRNVSIAVISPVEIIPVEIFLAKPSN